MRQADESLADVARRIKEETPIEQVIGAYYTLVPEGPRYLRAREHDSLVVDRRLGRYHWNSRGEWGDVIDFVRREESLSFSEALARLGAELGQLPRQGACRARPSRRSPSTGSRRTGETVPTGGPGHPDPGVLVALQAATELYHNELLASHPALGYLARRGVGPGTVRRLRLGYASGLHLKRLLAERGIAVGLARRAGLLARAGRPGSRPGPAPRDSELHEFLAGRIVIPELGDDGPVWMIGRTLDCETGPRYLGLPLARPLLGYHGARRSPLLFVTEGCFDYLALCEWGLPGVALAGTDGGTLALAQLRELAAKSEVCLVPQTDPAGKLAGERLRAFLPRPAPVVALPAPFKDLGELAEAPNGREVFLGLLPGSARELLEQLALNGARER